MNSAFHLQKFPCEKECAAWFSFTQKSIVAKDGEDHFFATLQCAELDYKGGKKLKPRRTSNPFIISVHRSKAPICTAVASGRMSFLLLASLLRNEYR
jgi:hypothetical protein